MEYSATPMGTHPRGLSTLFFTEFWERFSYYGFTGLATLFMAADPSTGGLGMEKSATLKLFGITVGMIFMAPLLGGWIADRFGAFRVLVGGSLLYAAGLVLMALSSSGIAFAGVWLAHTSRRFCYIDYIRKVPLNQFP